MKKQEQNPLAELPLGLGMALAQNMQAMNAFSALGPEGQAEIIRQARSASSHAQMRAIVDSLH
jgi:hypothetical protein